jgi:hemerythrin-like domain-containing protein
MFGKRRRKGPGGGRPHPLLRHHEPALEVAAALVRSATEGEEERRSALAAFIDAWCSWLASHLQDEDRWLAPLLPSLDDRRRLLREHRLLREMYRQSVRKWNEGVPEPQWMNNLGTRLRDHIHWEDTVVYPGVERRHGATRMERLVTDVREDTVRRMRERSGARGGSTPDGRSR